MQLCHKHLAGAEPGSPLAHAQTCISARARMLDALRTADPKSAAAKQQTYKYLITAQQENCRRLAAPPR